MRNLDGHRTLGLALWSSKGSLGNLGVHGVRGDLDPRGCPVTSCRATRAVVGSCDACGGSFFVFLRFHDALFCFPACMMPYFCFS